MSSEKSFYRSGELAELAGISTDTLRHYERKGVLARPLRKANDYRQYPASALQRVRLIRRAIAVGFTLDELASVLNVRDSGGAPCMEVRALAAAKLSDIETRLREMSELRKELRAVLKDWDTRLKHRAPGQRAHLLESLNAGRNGGLGNRRQGSVNLAKKKRAKKSPPAQPMSGMSEMQDEKMNERGDHVMGFDHTKTTHHFRLLADGGSIEVAANSPQDTESRDQIRMHLGHIAKMFAAGNFNAPMLIHDQIPPGVPTMQKLKSDIQYKFEETEQGARIRISTSSPEALQAIYDFLRFQIKEHKTGDSLDVGQ